MKTTRVRNEDVQHEWYIIDASDKALGRVATVVARYLMGKNKVAYSRDVDNGCGVIVTNISQIRFTGNKVNAKRYYSHSRYIGNLKETTLADLMEKKPEKVIFHAVKGMLPKNSLGRNMLKRLRVYTDNKHNQQAQCPQQISF